MYLSIPLTGRVVSYNPLIGDDNDPVRPISIDLGCNVSWTLISIDLEHDLALIDIAVEDRCQFPTGKVDENNEPIMDRRVATAKERQAFLDNAKSLIQDKSIDRLYEQSKSARLKKP